VWSLTTLKAEDDPQQHEDPEGFEPALGVVNVLLASAADPTGE